MGIKKEENLEVSLMKKMLKIIAMLLVVATVVFAAGCASKEAKNTTSVAGQEESGAIEKATAPAENEGAPGSDLNATPGNGSELPEDLNATPAGNGSELPEDLNATPGNVSEGASGPDLTGGEEDDSGNTTENETEE
jgi:hypothetical protein